MLPLASWMLRMDAGPILAKETAPTLAPPRLTA